MNNNLFDKLNNVRNLNAESRARSLQDQVNAYNHNLKKGGNTGISNFPQSRNLMPPSYDQDEEELDSIEENNDSKKPDNRSKNSAVTNELASAGLTAAGVPKPVADQLVKSKLGQKALETAKKQNKALAIFDGLMGGEKETEEEYGGEVNFKIPKKVIRYTLIAMPGVVFIMVFCCLFISATQIYFNSIKLGQADNVSSADAEKVINKKTEDNLNESVDDVAFSIELNNQKSLTFAKTKLESSNLVLTASKKKRKYNEADLKQLEDFYPSIVDLSKNYDENMVYDFFFKMYNLYTYYQNHHNLDIDLPLLMSTLNLQSNDMYVIFSSNLSAADRKSTKRKDFSDFDYEKNWEGYVTNTKESTHDMEVLAQNMFAWQVTETCTNSSNTVTKKNILKDFDIGTVTLECEGNEVYGVSSPKLVKDEEKYKNFLKEFLEKKYYLDGKTPLDGNYTYVPSKDDNSSSSGNGSSGENNPSPGEDNTSSSEKDPSLSEGGNGSSSGNNNPSSGGNNNQTSKPSSGDWRNWKQCGGNWGSMIVPKSNESMCKIGCLITSLAIQIKRSGTKTTVSPIDPGVASQNFSFASGGNLLWESVQNLAPNFIEYTTLYLTGMSKSSIADMLSKYETAKYYIVLYVKNSSIPNHYVALDYIDTKTGDIYIIDPGRNTNLKLYDVYNVHTAIVYEKKD